MNRDLSWKAAFFVMLLAFTVTCFWCARCVRESRVAAQGMRDDLREARLDRDYYRGQMIFAQAMEQRALGHPQADKIVADAERLLYQFTKGHQTPPTNRADTRKQ